MKTKIEKVEEERRETDRYVGEWINWKEKFERTGIMGDESDIPEEDREELRRMLIKYAEGKIAIGRDLQNGEEYEIAYYSMRDEDECEVCGSKEDTNRFSIESGEVVMCENCYDDVAYEV